MNRTILLLILLSFPFQLCAFPRGASPDAQKLIGTWSYLDQGEIAHCKLNYREDGTFSISYQIKGGILLRLAGRWTLQDKKICYTYTSANIAGIKGTSGCDELTAISETSHTMIEGKGGARKVYRRIER